MYPLRERRPSVLINRPARRPRLLLESLESRRLLSATSSSTTITPDVTTVTADFGRGPGFGGSGSGGSGTGITNPTPASTALTPSQLAAAYSISLSSTTGNGETIAIVDAYNDPNIAADLAKFDSQYNLPAANLTVENESGQTTRLPQTDAGWSLEISLDVEWAHAAAPGAKIVLVEANSASTSDLMAAVQTAAKQANVVSMSWGGSEFKGETAYDTAAYFANPNVTFIAASGDDGGAAGAEWPAVSPDVVSVGGTTLSLTSSGATLSETAWSASGSRFTGYSGSTGGAVSTSRHQATRSVRSAAASPNGRRPTSPPTRTRAPACRCTTRSPGTVRPGGSRSAAPAPGAGMGRNRRGCRPGPGCRQRRIAQLDANLEPPLRHLQLGILHVGLPRHHQRIEPRRHGENRLRHGDRPGQPGRQPTDRRGRDGQVRRRTWRRPPWSPRPPPRRRPRTRQPTIRSRLRPQPRRRPAPCPWRCRSRPVP